ncbi:Fibrinogen-like protein A,Ryncolin-4,Angiopoietin-related protein 7,Angiopoietin-related protein 1,Ficolin-3,Ficolin-1-B,Ficolin-2,Ryncolin-1,Tenascin-R,Fibrinogen-like protein 1,Tenascin-X,Fibrinogen C domain-containing protein 1-A,Ryncolin-3,Tenascin,Fibroleukin,Fibrinogen C domain-containing protein 1,Ryncolin-2,Angiopoietin-2,Angiopoietin-related protein 2,Microfibril-associated glycoprotein 4,Ficolin-1-A,Ficolin-1,Fibrinogen C domain-containing protein 1-B [Mytilus coruscus]|uniref:Fibrinogen C-terminal domain-containing protein n=1 Tax=Mytilus coruscus TaxID=42192 RepID=A0A6J8BJE9_MYTCO|nr:Fibrinogen-like protein A,Ryncolin-4,Angiopoietin-related protein 7,Angiopoietin-related protein 1,Ficolin-3,Ficolin-1-B,Ficolin-2,Ryncolin-1,Tenascin-R,Fibrinogen-like protein 1,Tenascin-X,Fibrinogen C domain-containing protein 1-A,Ryncolin-3,Tenascin,Fibroleukin,Fibrinogen C domain-containing protein 1,Ryncolin-2,Angiopoietin-2,Angiopoietin-related protein 2,Microfibril-associated glycoprotein 4,Ficolin-1-A,Ficolin-1,Fibrinogen C domain-containing protein 1-B [Mytilus coruscus]
MNRDKSLRSKLLLLLLFQQCSSFLEDVCENDDYECQHPDDVDGIGHLQHNKSQNINILRRLQRMSMLQCVKECFMTSQCIAINYRKNWKLCDILDKLPDGENIQNESGSIYTKIASWPKSLAGGCSKITCKPGQKCEKQPNGGLGYCESPAPTTPNATCIETFGLYRNLGTGIQFKCNNGFTIKGRPFQVCSENGEWKQLFCCIKKSLRPHDCGDIPIQCPSEVYKIYPTATSHLDVYCDMETAGGRWTRRIDGSTDFYREWSDYEQGFGRLDSEYWLGNQNIHTITSSGNYELYIHLEDFDGKTIYAQYSTFNVEDSQSNFILHISGYTGNAGDSLKYHNNMMFTTTNKDNDRWSQDNCADLRKGAWWYKHCIKSNLNGKYGYRNNGQIIWKSWKIKESMKSTKMMIKKTQEL